MGNYLLINIVGDQFLLGLITLSLWEDKRGSLGNYRSLSLGVYRSYLRFTCCGGRGGEQPINKFGCIALHRPLPTNNRGVRYIPMNLMVLRFLIYRGDDRVDINGKIMDIYYEISYVSFHVYYI